MSWDNRSPSFESFHGAFFGYFEAGYSVSCRLAYLTLPDESAKPLILISIENRDLNRRRSDDV